MRCFCNNTLQNASTNASEEKHVELNISTKQVCQQHVPNICILGTIVELLLHSKESCRNRKFNIMRGERTAGTCIKKNLQKNSKKKNHIHRTMCYYKYNYIFQKRCLCTKHDKQTYQQTLPKKQKHLAKLMPDKFCK